MVLNLIIIVLFFAKVASSMMVNYVKPLTSERASPCSNVQRPCLTLNEYASDSDEYFVNNTRFCFYHGIHRLDYSVNLVNLHNFSFLGWPNGGQVVTIAVDPSVSITWNESWNIEISSITFTLHENFTFIMRFKHSKFVRLSNVSIYGNGYNGCSSIISQRSVLEFINSMFIGLNGFVGAVLTIFASKITFRGNIVFANNTAASGGSIYLINSTLTFNGTSLFLNNTSSQEAMNRKKLSCNNINLVRDIKLSKLENGSGGAIVCHISYLEIYYYSNFTGNIAGRHGGAMVLHTCVLIIQGNASFVENEAYRHGGAIVAIQRTSSHVNGNLFMRKNQAIRGGAIVIREGNFTIKGDTLFDSNHANFIGGALHITSRANFIFCGTSTVYSESSSASFDADVLPLKKAKVFDTECSTDNATSFNNSITFLRNTAGHGGSIDCMRDAGITTIISTVTFIGTMYFNESYDSAIKGYGCNMAFIGTTYFYRNSAQRSGGAIMMSSDSNIMLSGIAYFERNVANYGGGAIALLNSKLIFKPNLNVFFNSNYANKVGGALYYQDDQCLLGSSVPMECFMTIDGPSASTSNISLHFENNSASFTGNILYGGQLNQCRLYFKFTATNQSDLCDCQVTQVHSYSDNALEIFLNMSDITQKEASDISSTAKEITFCEEKIPELVLYPGQQFIIPLKALGEANSTVPATVLWQRMDQGYEYRLSPSSGMIDDSCTNVSFWLYTSDLESLYFILSPLNPCQSLVEGLTLIIHVEPCPVGFDLSSVDSKCVCAMPLEKFGIQNCYIDGKSGTVERIKNNFWIFKQSNETLILHKFPCPLDYCTSSPLNVTLSNPSVQCDVNRIGRLCGQCQINFSLALGSLHCISCDNTQSCPLH